ncbi:hypothetical protein KM043_001697 [Ampulex compressa]|nr:hypothetical protein KM043_001697 [Ampulex compressa]
MNGLARVGGARSENGKSQPVIPDWTVVFSANNRSIIAHIPDASADDARASYRHEVKRVWQKFGRFARSDSSERCEGKGGGGSGRKTELGVRSGAETEAKRRAERGGSAEGGAVSAERGSVENRVVGAWRNWRKSAEVPARFAQYHFDRALARTSARLKSGTRGSLSTLEEGSKKRFEARTWVDASSRAECLDSVAPPDRGDRATATATRSALRLLPIASRLFGSKGAKRSESERISTRIGTRRIRRFPGRSLLRRGKEVEARFVDTDTIE